VPEAPRLEGDQADQLAPVLHAEAARAPPVPPPEDLPPRAHPVRAEGRLVVITLLQQRTPGRLESAEVVRPRQHVGPDARHSLGAHGVRDPKSFRSRRIARNAKYLEASRQPETPGGGGFRAR